MATQLPHVKLPVFTKKERIIEYSVIAFGAALFALGVVLFLLPYNIAPGGITGLGIIINHFLHTPVGATMLVLNIVIFFLGLKFLGREFSIKSLYATTLISVFIDLFHHVFFLHMSIEDKVLAPIFGGVVFGAGLGCIIRMGGGTIGSNTLARIISRHTNLKQGASIMLVNSGVVALAGFVFHSADVALYGFLSMYASSIVIDLIVEGLEYARGIYIISERTIEIADVIVYQFSRGATTIEGKGFYTQEKRDIIFTVVTRKEVHALTAIVKKLDPKAFMIITPVHEVLGKGFKNRSRIVA